jgi:beta-galactosidase
MEKPEARAEWEALTRAEMRRHRNHPSIVLWASSGNSFGHGHDQNPLAIGRRMEDSGLKWSDNDWKRARAMQGRAGVYEAPGPDPRRVRPSGRDRRPLGRQLVSELHSAARRRGVAVRLGASGTEPYLPIEFGAPFPTSFMRGREHFGQGEVTEPWMSEFAAIYLGPEAYRIETPEYARRCAKSSRAARSTRAGTTKPAATTRRPT